MAKTSISLSLKERGMYDIFIIAFGCVCLIPPLGFVYLAYQHNIMTQLNVVLFLFFIIMLSFSAMFMVWQTIRRIRNLRDALVASDATDSPENKSAIMSQFGNLEAAEVKEISQIVIEFNGLIDKLKENTLTLERIVYQITTLSELKELTGSIADMRELLNIVLKKTTQGVNSDTGSIMIWNDKKEQLTIAAAHGIEERIVSQTINKKGQGISGKVFQNGEGILVEDVSRSHNFNELANKGSGSFISLPLMIRNKTIGVLNVAKFSDSFSLNQNDMRFLKTLLNHIGFALENARLLMEAKNNAKRLEKVLKIKSTELDKTRQQMVDIERLRLLGELAAGVAHELNNPLTVLLGYAQLLMMSANADSKESEYLAKIQDQAIRTKKITQNLLLFARKQDLTKRKADVHELIDRALEVVGYEMKTSPVSVIKKYDAHFPQLRIDSHTISQVFINIVYNAYQAMKGQEKHGELRVITTATTDKMRISFQDNGPGIPAENLGTIFDPFFTTKDIGKGTGLGLSIAYAVIQEHGGKISAANLSSGGASFTIELPYDTIMDETEEIKASETEKSADPLARVPKSKRILIVDDIEEITNFLSSTLKLRGFEVITANNGNAALERLKSNSVDLIISDLKMPGSDGIDIFQTVLSDADLNHYKNKIIFVSGDTLGTDTQAFIDKHNLPFLNKPLMMDELFDLIAKVTADEPVAG